MKLIKTCLFASALMFVACQQESDTTNEGSLAETHPELEKQLARNSATQPDTAGSSEEIYQRYRITTEEYFNSGSYDVGNMYRGKLSPLDEKSHSEARTYRTALAEGLKQGVNFAGKYTVVTIGCGTSCQMHYVVDRENGKVLDKLQSSMGAKYNANSRLFIINPPDSTINYQECNNCAPEVYVFENNRFVHAPQD